MILMMLKNANDKKVNIIKDIQSYKYIVWTLCKDKV